MRLRPIAHLNSTHLGYPSLIVHPCLPHPAPPQVVDKADGAFHAVHGYTTEQVVRDQRFKVRMGCGARVARSVHQVG